MPRLTPKQQRRKRKKRDGIVTWVGPSNFSPPATQTPESCLNPSTNFAPFRTSMPHDICMQMNAMIPEILQYPNGPCAEVVYTLTLQGVPVEVLCGQNFGKDGHMDSKRHDCRLCISIRAACQHVTSPRKCMSGTAQPKRNAMAMASRARRLNSQRRRSSAWLVRARTNGTTCRARRYMLPQRQHLRRRIPGLGIHQARSPQTACNKDLYLTNCT